MSARRAIIMAGTDKPILGQCDLKPLAQHYPLATARFWHGLVSCRLFELEALAAAASQIKPQDIERRIAGQHAGSSFDKIEAHALSIGDHIRSIANENIWIMLAHIEQLPAYRRLIDAVLEAARPVIERHTGPILDPTGFIFISTQGAITPVHFDPEYNLFFQIAGTKQFTTFPSAPPLMTHAVNENYHFGGNNMLKWHADYDSVATTHSMVPGDALYVPYKAPHWVAVGDALSISLSITWKSGWAREQEDAHRLNRQLRQWGLSPRPLAPWPARAFTKAIGARILGKAGLCG